MFGPQVGYASHYQKNYVVDPNGQISVAYLNASGKTIATALAGNGPQTMAALASGGSSAKVQMNQELIRNVDFSIDASNLNKEASSSFVVAVKSDYTLKFSIHPSSLETGKLANGQTLCTTCYYQMELKVFDECDQVIGSKTTTPFNLNDGICYNDANPGSDILDELVLSNLDIGSYRIVYTVKLSDAVIASQVENYISNNTELLTKQAFLNQALSQLNLLECYSDCRNCSVRLGTLEEFSARTIAQLEDIRTNKFPDFTLNTSDPTFQSWLQNQYNLLLSNCNSIMADCLPSPCDQKLSRMKQDVFPGGQYALYTTTVANDLTTYAFADPATNVMVNYNTMTEFQTITVTDEAGNTVYVKDLNESDFIAQYLLHEEWADIFVTKHIEYCTYLWCKDQNNPVQSGQMESSYKFDQYLREVLTNGQLATDQQYFSRTNLFALLEKDPFFSNYYGRSWKGNMARDLQDASNVLRMTPKSSTTDYLPTKNLLQLTDWLLYCMPTTSGATNQNWIDSWTCSPTSTCRSISSEWNLFRNYYLQLKNKYVELAKARYNPTCKNCFIGASAVPSTCDEQNAGSQVICPDISEFMTRNENIINNSTPDITNRSYDIYYVHKNGPVSNNVKVIFLNYHYIPSPTCGLKNPIVTSDTAILLAGTDKVFLGTVTEYYDQSDPNCTVYMDEYDEYFVQSVSCETVCQTIVTGATSTSFASSGTYFYGNGFSSDGTGTPSQTMTNGDWKANCGTDLSTCGPLNRSSIWISELLTTYNQWIGIERDVYFPPAVAGSYYVGLGGEDLVSFKVDGVEIIRTSTASTAYWKIYPFSVSPGVHHIAIMGKNTSSPAAFGCEIYNDNYTTLSSSIGSNYSSLEPRLVFSTRWERGKFVSLACGDPLSANCVDDPRRTNYSNKVRIWDDFYNPAALVACNLSESVTTKNSTTASAVYNMALDNLNAQKASWLLQLKAVVNEEPALSSIAELTINNLVNDLYLVAKKNLDMRYQEYQANQATYDINKIKGASILQSGEVASNGYHSFLEVFQAYASTQLANGFSPELLPQPYPFGKDPLTNNFNGISLQGGTCTQLTALQQRFTSITGGGDIQAFHNWLKQELNEDYSLSVAELQDLSTRCSANCNLLDNPISLPGVLSLSATGTPWLSCTTVTNAIASFDATYSGVNHDSKLYRILLENYLNHQFGYGLSISEYLDFKDNCQSPGTTVLYNKPSSPDILPEPYACEAGLLASAMSEAGRLYTIYIETKKKEFTNALVAKCLGTDNTLRLQGDVYEYHYTLYYYDQSGQLIKTVPPEGVVLLTDTELPLVKDQLQAYTDCTNQEFANTTDPTYTIGLIGGSLAQGINKSMEFWLFNDGETEDKIFRFTTPENQYFVQGAISNGMAWMEVYQVDQTTGQIDLSASAKVIGKLPTGMPPGQWSHFVVQSPTADWFNSTLEIAVNGKFLTIVPETEAEGFPADWEMSVGDNGNELPADNLAVVKQVRVYVSDLTAAEIQANYYNPCRVPVGRTANQNYLYPDNPDGYPQYIWGHFNQFGLCENPNGGGTKLGQAIDIVNSAPVGSTSNLTTVSNNFTIEFWAYADDRFITLKTESTSGTSASSGQVYIVVPASGGLATNNVAGMGISLGFNGVNIIERADNYMAPLLSWNAGGTALKGWHHYAIVYNNKRPSLYVDGVFKRQGLQSAKTTIFPSLPFVKESGFAMYGQMDEVRVWNRPLTSTDIQANYKKSITGTTANGIVAYWPISNADVSMIKDVSCNHNDIGLSSSALVDNGLDYFYDWTIQESATDFQFPPFHRLGTMYAYNSQNQVVRQYSPDADISKFWYDKLARLIYSQNAKQAVPQSDNQQFSFTNYDALGRIITVGQQTMEPAKIALMTEENLRDPATVANIRANGVFDQVTLTQYDELPSWAPSGASSTTLNYRNRVAATALISAGLDGATNRKAASYYTYDITGNVEQLVQENKDLVTAEGGFVTGDNGLKTIRYEYDLISGKVNQVLYQPGKWDQYSIRYQYDAENRLVKAQSSRNPLNTESGYLTDATYTYYYHGPLARVELGKNKVQALDYAYTLQGWLKGMNGQVLDPTKTMANDGVTGGATANFGRDVVGFSLGYYQGDYAPIDNTAKAFENVYLAPTVPTAPAVSTETGHNLYNGNISTATYAFKGISSGATTGYSYRYDQLNRLVNMRQHPNLTLSGSWSNSSISSQYAEDYSFDANGNLKTLLRKGNTGQTLDNFQYSYPVDANGQLVSNKLRNVTGTNTDDYQYDPIGNLVQEKTDGVDKTISWTVYGKIASIVKADGTTIEYGYDAAGNRITKKVTSGTGVVTTYYVRDAQGNVLGVYDKNSTTFTWQEQHLYGSSRLGMVRPQWSLSASQPLSSDAYNAVNDPVDDGIEGKRVFEITNHLGNVLTTLSDRSLQVETSGGGSVSYYVPEILSEQDYYPFGLLMQGRGTSIGSYRYGFNGQEMSNEIKGVGNSYTAEYWEYDPRVGRRWNVDPLKLTWESSYLVNGNNPIFFIDPDGDFKSRFGAFLYKITHGGGEVLQAKSGEHEGEWRVVQRMTEDELKEDRERNPNAAIIGVRAIYNWNIRGVAKVESNLDVGFQLELKRKFGKIGGGFQVYELGKFSAGYDNGEWDYDFKEGDQRVHNYAVLELKVGKVGKEKIGVGLKYDYNYAYYNSYYGPQKDGEASHDWGAYAFNQSRGNTNLDKLFEPFSNPLTHKAKLGVTTKKGKPFFGIEDGGSIKVILGFDYKLKIGFYY